MYNFLFSSQSIVKKNLGYDDDDDDDDDIVTAI